MSSIIENYELNTPEKILKRRFDNAEDAEKIIEFITKHWDKRELVLIKPLPGEQVEEPIEKSGEKGKDKKGKKDQRKSAEEIEEEEKQKLLELEAKFALEEVGIPIYHHDTAASDLNQDKDAELEEIIAFLPDKLEILEGLGMGPNGPPIPAPTEFSVVPYPNKRELLNQNSKHFEFIATGIGTGFKW